MEKTKLEIFSVCKEIYSLTLLIESLVNEKGVWSTVPLIVHLYFYSFSI